MNHRVESVDHYQQALKVSFIEGFPAGFPVLFLRIRSSGSCTGRAVAEDVPLVVRAARNKIFLTHP